MKKQNLLSILLSIVLIAGLLPPTVIPAAADDNIYNINDSSGGITITAAGSYHISGTGETTNGIVVNADISGDVFITLENVAIKKSAGGAFSIFPGSTVYLTLLGTNSLKSGPKNAGLNVPAGASLVITADSTGSLTATGGNGGAGIGGEKGNDGGGGKDGYSEIPDHLEPAGAGGSGYTGGDCGTVTVNGGNITATGDGGAGIGGGQGGRGGNGGSVKGSTLSNLSGGTGGAGGTGGRSGTVTITGGSVRASIGGGAGGAGGAGGTGYAMGGPPPVAPSGTAGSTGSTGSCTITGGSVIASFMGPVPTDGTNTVYRTKVTTPLANTLVRYMADNSQIPVSCTTDTEGSLYLWLPVTGLSTTIYIISGTTYYKASGTVTTSGATLEASLYTVTTAPAVVTTSQSSGTVGEAYSDYLVAAGDDPILWSIDSGSLPDGLRLNTRTGTITGTPTKGGVFNFTVQAANPAGSATGALSTTISQPSNIIGPTTLTLNQGYAAVSTGVYTLTGYPAVTVTKASGTDSIAWNSGTNTLDIAAGLQEGVYPVALRVSNGVSPDQTLTFTLTVAVSPSIVTQSQSSGTVGEAYSDYLLATGDTPITWSVLAGSSLPEGLSLNPSSGTITGTPTAAGTFNFTVQATNGAGSATRTLHITINAATYTASIVPGSAAFNMATEGYAAQAAQTFVIRNTGTGTLSGLRALLSSGSSFEIVSGSLTSNKILPGGMVTVQARPKSGLAAGAYSDTLTVTGDNGLTATANLSFKVNTPVNAEVPAILVDLTDQTTGVGTMVTLNAAATVTDGGYLAYAWYSNTVRSTTGATALGVTTATYSPNVLIAGTTYYYCVITNTNDTVSGTKTATVTSAIAEVAVSTRQTGGSGGTTPQYQAAVGSDKNPVTVNSQGASASVTITAAQAAGGTTVTMPEISGVTRYQVVLPAAALSGSGTSGGFTIKTSAATLTVPANMLSGTTGTSAQLSVSTVIVSALSDAAKAAVGGRPVISLSLSVDGKGVAWNNPGAPVTVSIPYTPTAGELKNPACILIWYIDGSGNAVSVPNGYYDAATGSVTFTTTHFSSYAVGYNKVIFTDVPDAAWYADAVTFLAARSITSGTTAANFSPDATLTRGQFITLLLKAYGVAAVNHAAVNFSDAGNTYYTGYLAAAKQLGISNGVGNNKFEPEKAVTRQEMFTLLYNALKTFNQLPASDNGKSIANFIDSASVAPYAQEAINYLVKAGVVGGNNGSLLPQETTTRAQMARVLYNLMGK